MLKTVCRIALVAFIATAMGLALPALAGTPAQKSITVNAGSGSWALDRDYAAFRITHVLSAGVAAQTNTIMIVQADGTITNTLGTILCATSKIFLSTNTIWLFKGDRIQITGTDTNAQKALIVGEFQD